MSIGLVVIRRSLVYRAGMLRGKYIYPEAARARPVSISAAIDSYVYNHWTLTFRAGWLAVIAL